MRKLIRIFWHPLLWNQCDDGSIDVDRWARWDRINALGLIVTPFIAAASGTGFFAIMSGMRPGHSVAPADAAAYLLVFACSAAWAVVAMANRFTAQRLIRERTLSMEEEAPAVQQAPPPRAPADRAEAFDQAIAGRSARGVA